MNVVLSVMCMLVTIHFTYSPRWLCDCLLKASEYKGGGLHVFPNLWGFVKVVLPEYYTSSDEWGEWSVVPAWCE